MNQRKKEEEVFHLREVPVLVLAQASAELQRRMAHHVNAKLAEEGTVGSMIKL